MRRLLRGMVTVQDRFAPPVDARDLPRSSMFLAAVFRAGTEQAPAKVRNMSSKGAMIESSLTPTVGSTVDLMRGALLAQGTVIWNSGNRCGVLFSSEIVAKDWLAAPTKVQQNRVDYIVALVRAGGADARLDFEATHTPRSHKQLVDDLGVVIVLLQDLEDYLATSDANSERHAMKLQNLDIGMQMLRAVGAELMPDGSSRRLEWYVWKTFGSPAHRRAALSIKHRLTI